MSKLSLRTRIFLSYFVLIALSTILINWLSIRQIAIFTDENFHRGFDQKVDQILITLEDELAEQIDVDVEFALDEVLNNEGVIQQEIVRLADTFDVHIELIDLEGDFVLFDSATGRDEYPTGDWEELWSLLHDDEPDVIEYEELSRVYNANYLFYREEEVLVVRVGESWLGIEQAIRNWRVGLVISTIIIGAILFIGLGGWLANALTQSLTQLRQSAQTMAGGNLSVRSTIDAPQEIAQLARDFNQMAEAVETMVAEQKAFASNAAHELRTPLTAIRIRTEALLEDDADLALTQRYIREIDDEARRLSRLVEDLRVLSRSDAHNLAMGNEQVDMGRLLRAIQTEFDTQLVEKNLSYQATIPEDPLLMEASMAHLRIVLRNLIENAIKYTPNDGRIVVALQQKDSLIQIWIADNGIGIAPEDLPLLFNRFYRVDKSHNRKIAGSGLGLSLVQSIVRLYGGTISIQSAGVGMGTTVELHLPVVERR